MTKKLSFLSQLCTGVVCLSLLLVANPAFAKNDKSAPATNSPSTPTTTPSSPTQAASTATSDFTVGLNDLGKIFRINFDGNVATQTVSGLSAFADFTFQGFTTEQGKTIAAFKVLLDNTSSGNILSRVSGLGFNTNQKLLSSSVNGLFSDAHLGGSFPNQFGKMDVCFNGGNTCQGGANGGVSNSTSLPGTFDSGLFSLSLVLDGSVSSLSLSNFGVRYQSIGGTSLGTSGTGSAVSITPVTTPPVATPPVATPPVATPPVTTPPVTTPPVTTPPVTTPPVTTPPVATPPVATPPVTTPPIFNEPIDGTAPNQPPDSTPPDNSTVPPTRPSTPKPTKVPEPSAIAALALISAISIRHRRKQEANVEG
jgi:hypothetical protein